MVARDLIIPVLGAATAQNRVSERVVRLVVNAQLAPALVRWLTTQGVESEYVFDVGLAEASDAVIWQRVTARP